MQSQTRDAQDNNSQHYLQVENYLFHLQNSEPCHYSRIPYIINYLTYTYIDPATNEKSIKKLSVHAKILYQVIKQYANDAPGGRCWANRDSLAEMCNMSPGMVTNAKHELAQNFHELDGNPLIVITKCQKASIKNEKVSNKTLYDKIGVVDIWKYNNAYIKTKAYQNPPITKEDLFDDEAPSPHDSAGIAPSPHDTAPQGALSPHDTNKKHSNENPMSKEQQTTASAVNVVSKEKNRLFASPSNEKSYKWLLQNHCDEPLAFSIATKFSANDLSLAIAYVKKMEKSPKFKGFEKGPWAYLQNTLQNRYWE